MRHYCVQSVLLTRVSLTRIGYNAIDELVNVLFFNATFRIRVFPITRLQLPE